MNTDTTVKPNVAQGTKHIQAALVLIIGTAAALLFHQDRVAPPERPATSDLLVRRAQAPAERYTPETQLLAYTEAVPAGGTAAPTAPRTAAQIDATAAWVEPRPARVGPTAITAAAGPPPRAVMRPYVSAATSGAAAGGLTSQPANAARKHQVRDGDTLGDLAERYYGDARRYREIFDANRRVLTNPEVLPIGVTLDIPGFDPASVRPPGPPPAARLVPQVLIRTP